MNTNCIPFKDRRLALHQTTIKSIHGKVCRDSRKVTFKQSADKISKKFAGKVPKANDHMWLSYKAILTQIILLIESFRIKQ